MIQPYKDREVSIGDQVRVYRNLNNSLFSIKSVKSGLVLAHGDNFIVRNGVTHVSESGRKRVLNKKQRNVHAWITGELVGSAEDEAENWIYDEVYYNPYSLDQFLIKETMKQLGEYDVDFLFKDGKCYLIH